MKMFQVHDDNHDAHLCLAIDAGGALVKVWEKHQAIQDNFDGNYDDFLESYIADELEDCVQLDNDGPVQFY